MTGPAQPSSEERIERLWRALSGLPESELHESLRRVIVPLTLAERFALLHRLGVYHHPETFSGFASTLEETAALRAALPGLIAAHAIGSVLDIPCGDFHWLRQVSLEVDYTGADIVPELVAANQRRHAGAHRRFVVLDATRDPLPEVDLVLCRDLLIHLSLADAWAALRNFHRSGSRWLLTNHFAGREENPDILSGDFRPIHLCRPPFDFPPPEAVIAERSQLAGGTFADRSMALWWLADLGPALA